MIVTLVVNHSRPATPSYNRSATAAPQEYNRGLPPVWDAFFKKVQEDNEKQKNSAESAFASLRMLHDGDQTGHFCI
jgi:hypothetical protein